VVFSDNASTQDYSSIKLLCENYEGDFTVRYFERHQTLGIDEHMHFLVSVASHQYIFLLGDDDFLLTGALRDIEALITLKSPDLVICNALVVDAKGDYIRRHMSTPPETITDNSRAFLTLKDKCNFGLLLVNRDMYADASFAAFYGTAHAYASFWLDILKRERGETQIIIPEEPISAIRRAAKSYNLIDVHFNRIPDENKRYVDLSEGLRAKSLARLFQKRYEARIQGVAFGLSLGIQGYSIRLMRKATNVHLSARLQFGVAFGGLLRCLGLNMVIISLIDIYRERFSRGVLSRGRHEARKSKRANSI
jgi:hypothetical protein